MNLSEEAINEAAVFVGSYLNKLLAMFEDIARGKDPKLFYRVAFCLWLTSFIGGLTDLITLGYTGKLFLSVSYICLCAPPKC